MPLTNYPGADRSQWKPQFGGVTMKFINKIVLHTTETQGWPGYPSFAPQMTVDVVDKKIRQHMPLNLSASTLSDPSSTPVRENRDDVVQLEIVGYCDPARKSSTKHISKWGDDEYKFLAEIIVWFSREWQVPLSCTVDFIAYPSSYGLRAKQRLTSSQYDAYRGILGHQHASGNDHGDPGNIDINKLMKFAKEIAGGTVIPEPEEPVWDGKSFPGAAVFFIGSNHPAVTVLGQRLVVHGWKGYSVGPGIPMGQADVDGTKWFQEKQGWTGSNADGIPGPSTWALLMENPVTPPTKGQPILNGKITTAYGVKGSWAAGYHPGDDWNGPFPDYGQDVFSIMDGTVVYVGPAGWGEEAYGSNAVIIEYPSIKRRCLYAHMRDAIVKPGQTIKAGQKIGEMGWSGNVIPKSIDGTHLHVEQRVSPYRYGTDARSPIYVAPSKPSEPTGVNVRVATWNTRRSSYAADTGKKDWDYRDDMAREFLLGIDGGVPGILLTQETTKEQTGDIARMTGLRGIGNGLGGHPKDVSGDNCAVLVNEGDYTVKKVHTVNSGGSSPRFMTIVEVARKGQSASVWYGSTHLTQGSDNGALRAKEIDALLKAAKAKGVNFKRFIWAGDINEGAGQVRTIAKNHGTQDIRAKLDDAGFTGNSWDTFTGWDAEVEKNGRHIDAIFIGSDIKVREAEVVPVRNGASDHNLVMAYLTL